jgi:hypothetical protein
MQPERLFTRKEAIAFLRDTYDVTITLCAFQRRVKLCIDYVLPQDRWVPLPVAKCGHALLYRRIDLEDWGQRLNAGQNNVTG